MYCCGVEVDLMLYSVFYSFGFIVSFFLHGYIYILHAIILKYFFTSYPHHNQRNSPNLLMLHKRYRGWGRSGERRHRACAKVAQASTKIYLQRFLRYMSIKKCTGLSGRVAFKNPFLRKGNGEKSLSYSKLHKDWTENLWQQHLCSAVFGSNCH